MEIYINILLLSLKAFQIFLVSLFILFEKKF